MHRCVFRPNNRAAAKADHALVYRILNAGALREEYQQNKKRKLEEEESKKNPNQKVRGPQLNPPASPSSFRSLTTCRKSLSPPFLTSHSELSTVASR